MNAIADCRFSTWIIYWWSVFFSSTILDWYWRSIGAGLRCKLNLNCQQRSFACMVRLSVGGIVEFGDGIFFFLLIAQLKLMRLV